MQPVDLVAIALHQAHMGDIQAADIGDQGKDVAIAELGQHLGQGLQRDVPLSNLQIALKGVDAIAVVLLLHRLVAAGVTAHEIETSQALGRTGKRWVEVSDGALGDGGLGPATEVVLPVAVVGCAAAVAQLLQLTFKALFRVAAG